MMRKILLELSLKVGKELQIVCDKLDLDDLQKDEIDEAVTAVFNKEMSASSNEMSNWYFEENEIKCFHTKKKCEMNDTVTGSSCFGCGYNPNNAFRLKATDKYRFCNHHHELTKNHKFVDYGDGKFVANKEAIPLLKALNEIGLKTRSHHIDDKKDAWICILLDNVNIEIKTVYEMDASRKKYRGKKELLISWTKPETETAIVNICKNCGDIMDEDDFAETELCSGCFTMNA